MALQVRQLAAETLASAMVLVAAGAAFGVVLALGTARLVSSMLFGVGAYDPVTFVTAPALPILTALLACYLPARRAARVSPLTALRRL